MKKSLLTTFLFLLSILLTVAAPVDEQSARKLANDFMRSKMPATRSVGNITRAVTGVADDADAGIYVFNSESGFVVISADDTFPAVLAYGSGNPYDCTKAPAAMQEMLEAYHHAVTATVKTRADVPTHTDIAPLIKTTWNQKAPYNNLCPDQSPTGCVATAVAQVMYYHQHPTSYEWSKMKGSYKSTDVSDAATAVAKLMADVGEKVYMTYGSSESSARLLDACEALRYDFGYSETTEFVERDCYTAKTWDELLYNELAASRPVLMGAQSMSSAGEGGHAFIIDGYQAKDGVGYFHVNWGWGGSSDEYFLISVLNPQYQYTGGHAGSSGYSYDQNAIIGAQPAATAMSKTTRFLTTYCNIENDKGSYTRASASENFPEVTINFSVLNVVYPKVERQYDIALALYKGNEQIKILDQGALKDILEGGKALSFGSGCGLWSKVSFGSGLADGTYQIRVLSRENGKTDWAWALEAACRYIELTINGTSMTTTTYGNSEEFDSNKDFTINSVTVSGSKKVGEPLTITVNLKNNHMPNNAPIFLWANASLAEGADKYQCVGGGGTNLAPGETGDVVLEYTPQRAGTFNFVINGTSKELKDSLYKFSADVTGLYITLELAVDGATAQSDGTNKVDGTTLKGVAKLANMGSEDYNNLVYIRLLGLDDKDHNKALKETNQIAKFETLDVPFSFEELVANNRYLLLVSVMDGDTEKPLNYIDNGDGTISYYYKYTYQMTESTGIDTLKLDAPDAEVYNMRGVRMGKASELKSLPKGIYIINNKKVINK